MGFLGERTNHPSASLGPSAITYVHVAAEPVNLLQSAHDWTDLREPLSSEPACCLKCKTSTPLHFQRTVLRQLFSVAVFAGRALRIRDHKCKKVNTKGLSGACDSRLTSNQRSNANTTTLRNKKMKQQNWCNDFQKLFCILTAQSEQIQKVT